MTELIKTIVTPLVDYPDDIRIQEEINGNKVIYKLSVHKDDMGKIIGKHGRVAQSIRNVVYAAATKEKKHVQLDIV